MKKWENPRVTKLGVENTKNENYTCPICGCSSDDMGKHHGGSGGCNCGCHPGES